MYMMQMCSMMQTLISQGVNKTAEEPLKEEKKSNWVRDYNDYDDDYSWRRSYFDEPVQK